ncbi:MAG: hypothetical protein D8M57_09815 [Candidatus Scalindua sp. AMX11]|nr:MAG: hypothetical protein DWQ00_08565 [Candidatus Scalindua sp.]NOG84896.1 hypothetical protein [Planctomycetota bacterium]RZV84963.1 MAG: hypothetical protein EX341_08125 [Candidatus Scalindua sp. SCAELEC01]TDE65043.1 MAG: hypothetical protein D8M57_09815 [Candidatus Scalindua sp. AMX11]
MTSRKNRRYYCEICRCEVEARRGGDGTLVCCKQAMKEGG